MEIFYLEFTNPVSVGGEFGTLSSWSKQKNGEAIECVEKGSWIVLTIIKGPNVGERRRIPITSVNYISEREVQAAKGLAK